MATNALDLLDQEDPAELSSAALGEDIEELFTIQNRVAAAITRRVAVFDRSGAARPTTRTRRLRG